MAVEEATNTDNIRIRILKYNVGYDIKYLRIIKHWRFILRKIKIKFLKENKAVLNINKTILKVTEMSLFVMFIDFSKSNFPVLLAYTNKKI